MRQGAGRRASGCDPQPFFADERSAPAVTGLFIHGKGKIAAAKIDMIRSRQIRAAAHAAGLQERDQVFPRLFEGRPQDMCTGGRGDGGGVVGEAERHGVVDGRIKGPPAGVAQGLGVRGRDGRDKAGHDEDNAELGHDFYDFTGLSDTGVVRPFPCHVLGSPG
jgi:hypothetical protein